MPVARAEPTGGAPADGERAAAGLGVLEERVLAELGEAGQVDSVLGRAAAALARRIDRSFADTGSAYAALHRELRATLEQLAASARPASPVDELRRKREERLRAG